MSIFTKFVELGLEDTLLNKASLTLATAAELKSLKINPAKYFDKMKAYRGAAVPNFVGYYDIAVSTTS